jgi:CheY-like chemotaxis protein
MTDAPAPIPVAAVQTLIMDDSRSARFALGKFLESLGCTVDSVGDLAASLAFLDRSRPQLMFLDHDAEDVGFQALRAIKLHAAGRMMPVVLCLSDDLPGFESEARAHGAVAVLIKPPTRDGLAALLSTLMPGIVLSPRTEIIAAPDNIPSVIDDEDELPEYDQVTAPLDVDTRGERIAQELASQAQDIREGIASLDPAQPAGAPAMMPTIEAAPATPVTSAASGDVESRLQQLESRLRALEQNVQKELMELRVQLDLSLQAQFERIDQSRDAIRAMAAEEAQVIAERTVMGAAAKISDRLAESILKTLGKA